MTQAIEKEFRSFQGFELRAIQNDEYEELWVEGYAVRFNSPTVLWEDFGIEFKEQISDKAFAEADMKDVIFNYNHAGKVMARTRNKTLQLMIDDIGLRIRARLDGTLEGRTLYDEIKGGYIDKMSFAFTVRESSFDELTYTRTVTKIKRLYDVSAVSIPAYDDTSLMARDYFTAEKEKIQSAKIDEQKKIILIQSML